MDKELTVKNLLLNWKKSEIIECDDWQIDERKWSRIAVLKYNEKLYYVHIFSGIVKKVVPLEKMDYAYYNEQKRKEIDYLFSQKAKEIMEQKNN